MKKISAFFLLMAIWMGTPVWAGGVVVGDDDTFVYIQADGDGVTKMEALNHAWIEAVRMAVGMFMTGSTQISNDELQEKITAYSRGRVKTYEVLSETLKEGVWNIAIKAAIEKDVLLQSNKRSKKKAINSNRLANIVTSTRQSIDAKETVDNFVIYNSPEDCLDYSCDIQNVNGKIYALHLIRVNHKKFNDIVVKNISQLLDEFAEAKFDVPQGYSPDTANFYAKKSNIKAIPENCSSLIERTRVNSTYFIGDGTTFLSDCYYYSYDIAPFDLQSCRPSKYKKQEWWNLRHRTIRVTPNLKKCKAYILHDQSLVEKIIKKISDTKYRISFFTDIECGAETLRFESHPLNVVFFAEGNLIYPIIMKYFELHHIESRHFNIFVAHELSIPQNKISQISNITGGYDLTQYP